MLTPFAPGRPAREAHAALKAASATEESARKCAVLWFAEIHERSLYRELGHASMQAYARVELGYSETRIGDFLRLARKLDQLPAIRQALPEIGYTKAREILQVASPRTEDAWVEAARTHSRTELTMKVKRARNRARKPAASLFAPTAEATNEAELAAEVPVRVSLEFTPEQFARWEGLWESLRKQGVTGDRPEVLLAALAAERESNLSETATTNCEPITPRGMSAPPVQIHVHQCPDCARLEVEGRTLGRADGERLQCDAAIAKPGGRNTTTIPPRVRRQVLARDRHRCQTPGCGRTRFLEVHHRTARARGGGHDPANLVTLCAACHRLWHERGVELPGDTASAATP